MPFTVICKSNSAAERGVLIDHNRRRHRPLTTITIINNERRNNQKQTP